MTYMSDCCRPRIKKNDLVSNNVDASLINAWGIVTYGGNTYVSANGSDLLVRYDLCGKNPYDIYFCDESGNILSNTTTPVVSPTGIAINTTNGYLVSDGTGTNVRKSILLIASESGDLFGYNPEVGGGQKAYRIYAGSAVVPTTPFYTGIAVTNKHIFATDFLNGNIDIFSDIRAPNSINFNSRITVTLSPPNFTSAFNIVSLHGMLYVLYANKVSADAKSDNGGGFIDVRNVYGGFIRYFNTDCNSLASPWGLTPAPEALCCPRDTILVGNHKSGQINAYDRFGNRIGEIYDDGRCPQILTINGLWGIFTNSWKVYFASGPNNESCGLVGFLEREYKPCNSCETINSRETINSYASCKPRNPCNPCSKYYFC